MNNEEKILSLLLTIQAEQGEMKKELSNLKEVKEVLKDIAPMKEMLMEHELKFRRMKIS